MAAVPVPIANGTVAMRFIIIQIVAVTMASPAGLAAGVAPSFTDQGMTSSRGHTMVTFAFPKLQPLSFGFRAGPRAAQRVRQQRRNSHRLTWQICLCWRTQCRSGRAGRSAGQHVKRRITPALPLIWPGRVQLTLAAPPGVPGSRPQRSHCAARGATKASRVPRPFRGTRARRGAARGRNGVRQSRPCQP